MPQTVYYKTFMNVWGPLVEDYLSMGWMVDNMISENRGGYETWLLVWPCECKVPYIHHRYGVLGSNPERIDDDKSLRDHGK